MVFILKIEGVELLSDSEIIDAIEYILSKRLTDKIADESLHSVDIEMMRIY